jgi:hypothetical protein
MNGWQRFKLTAPNRDPGGERNTVIYKNRLVVLISPSGSHSGRKNVNKERLRHVLLNRGEKSVHSWGVTRNSRSNNPIVTPPLPRPRLLISAYHKGDASQHFTRARPQPNDMSKLKDCAQDAGSNLGHQSVSHHTNVPGPVWGNIWRHTRAGISLGHQSISHHIRTITSLENQPRSRSTLAPEPPESV